MPADPEGSQGHNLKRAEELFLDALAEDEDFPLVYYNLGVVYTELHGLAVVAGRAHEAQLHLSAAETAFGRAIEREPARWECYFAFAQTQFRYSRHASVVELCAHILQLRIGCADEAKVRQLWARALLEQIPPETLERGRPEQSTAAVDHAMDASRLALRSMARSRLVRRSSRRGENDAETRCAELATACLLTFSDIYSRHVGVIAESRRRRRGFRQRARIRRRLQWLVKLAPMNLGKAELRFAFGQRALERKYLDVAEDELAAARRSDPTRPSYSAGLALARATRLADGGSSNGAKEREQILELCLQALEGLAGSFFPSRDERAFEMVAAVYDRLGDVSDPAGTAIGRDRETARQLRTVAEAVNQRLSDSVSGASVSGIFLEILQSPDSPLSSELGEYGKAAQQASAHWREGTAQSEAGDNPRLYDKIGSSYWHIAFQGRTRASHEELEPASEHFNKALSLYGSGSEERVLTHYRLGKLNAARRDLEKARTHLDIVEASGALPVLGWVFLGFPYFERRTYSECEYYFGRVVKEGERLGSTVRLPSSETA